MSSNIDIYHWSAVSVDFPQELISKPTETGSLTSRVVTWLKGEGDSESVLICKRIAAVALAILLSLSLFGILYLIEGIYLWQNKKISKIEAEGIKEKADFATQHAADEKEAPEEPASTKTEEKENLWHGKVPLKTLMEKIALKRKELDEKKAKIVDDELEKKITMLPIEEEKEMHPQTASELPAEFAQIGPSKKSEDLSLFKADIPASQEAVSLADAPEGALSAKVIDKIEADLEIEKQKLSKFLEGIKIKKFDLITDQFVLPKETMDKVLPSQVKAQVEQEVQIEQEQTLEMETEQIKPKPVASVNGGPLPSDDETIKSAASLIGALLKQNLQAKKDAETDAASAEKINPLIYPSQTHFNPASTPFSPATVSAEPLTGNWMGKRITVLKSGTSSTDKSDLIKLIAGNIFKPQPFKLGGEPFSSTFAPSKPLPSQTIAEDPYADFDADLYGEDEGLGAATTAVTPSQFHAAALKPQVVGNSSNLPPWERAPVETAVPTPVVQTDDDFAEIYT